MATLIEQVFILEDAAIDMIDPATTAPTLDNDLSAGGQGNGGGEGVNTNHNQTAETMDQVEQGFLAHGHTRSTSILPPAVQDATDAFVDYASFVWEIAAQRSPAPASHELMVVAISTFWLVLITFVVFTENILEKSIRVLLIGLAVNVNLIFFYGAPLSKIAVVMETKSSKLIHVPTMIFSLINGTLWVVYGLAVSDPFIAVPNGFGAALGVVQVVLCVLFPRHAHRSGNGHGIFKRLTSSGDSSTDTDAKLSLPVESTPLI